jgi:hypothetical protein
MHAWKVVSLHLLPFGKARSQLEMCLQGVQIVNAATSLIDLPAVEPTCIDVSDFDAIQSLTSNWTAAGKKEVVRLASESRSRLNKAYDDLDVLVLLWTSTGLKGISADDGSVPDDLSLARVLSQIPEMTPFQLATLHEGIRTAGTSAPEAAQLAVPSIEGRLNELKRITGRTAYVTDKVGPATRAPTRAQAASLRVLNDEAIAAGVANDAPRTYPSYDLALISLALAEADVESGSATPDLSVTVSSGSLTLLEATFNGDGSAVAPVAAGRPTEDQTTASSAVPFERFGPLPQPIQASAEGSGKATVSTGLVYIPAEVPKSPTYGGLYVSMVYRAVNDTDGSPVGPALQVAPLAATLVVTVQVCCAVTYPMHNLAAQSF